MAWIESHTVLLRHRKVLQLSDDLHLPPVYIIGHLHALWHTILEQQEDGNLSEWPDAMIAQAAAYSGDATAFVLALQSRKMLDGKIVHDWMDYAGRYLQVKYRTSNPLRLLKIQKLHKSVRKTDSSLSKVRLKTDNLTLPNQPNLPYLKQAEVFWGSYKSNARKIGKGLVEKWFLKHRPSDELFTQMLARLHALNASAKWAEDGGKWIPAPMTWLNQERWKDDLAAASLVPQMLLSRPTKVVL